MLHIRLKMEPRKQGTYILTHFSDMIIPLDLVLSLAFLGGTVCVLLAAFVPRLGSFLKYGKTLQTGRASSRLNLCVPKSWFSHFYLMSLSLSLTGLVVTTSAPLRVADFVSKNHSRETIPSIETVFLVLLLNLIQSVRRLYECNCVLKTSPQSKMQITHYIAGVFFYAAINLHVVIEGLSFESQKGPSSFRINFCGKNLFAIMVFVAASLDQLRNHAHLASLRKYTIPSKGLFKTIACAHYFDEIMIYAIHFFLIRTWTAGLALVWVVVNLSVSAKESFNFYQRQCGKEGKVYPVKSCIIPHLL